jgi:hypothetical protein
MKVVLNSWYPPPWVSVGRTFIKTTVYSGFFYLIVKKRSQNEYSEHT